MQLNLEVFADKDKSNDTKADPEYLPKAETRTQNQYHYGEQVTRKW